MALDDLRNTVGICGMLRHRAFFDELAKTKETDATWRSTSAGLAVLRLGGIAFAKAAQLPRMEGDPSSLRASG